MRKWRLPREIFSAPAQVAPIARGFPSLDDRLSRLKCRHISSRQYFPSRGQTDVMDEINSMHSQIIGCSPSGFCNAFQRPSNDQLLSPAFQ